MAALEPEAVFRRRLHRMLEPRPARFHIMDGTDEWGFVVTRTVMEGVQVWYSAKKGTLTLGLTTPKTQSLVPEEALPTGAEKDVSRTGWLLYRWTAPKLDLTVPPEDQSGSKELVDMIKIAFAWFNDNRTDARR